MSSGILSARSRSIRENETPLSLPLAEDSEKRAVAAVYRKHADYIKQNVQLTRTHIRKLLTTGGVITQREFDSLCHQINRIFSTMSTNMNYRQFRCQTPELATLDKIESHTKSLLKIIDDCCKQFDLQTSKKSLKSSIIDLKLDRDNIFRKSKDQRSFLETKLRNERDKNEKLETMVKELQEFKDMFEGYTKAREMSQALREMKTEKKRVTDELEKIKEENKQLSRTLETTQAVLDIYKENATRAENELDRYKKLVTRLENDNGELSLKLC
ncbi:hypothetical protein MAR_032350, partial [Mya arenaria]